MPHQEDSTYSFPLALPICLVKEACIASATGNDANDR
jgi:hypothetical protein